MQSFQKLNLCVVVCHKRGAAKLGELVNHRQNGRFLMSCFMGGGFVEYDAGIWLHGVGFLQMERPP